VIIKMAKKRVTPEADFERFAERLWSEYGDDIFDIDSYNSAFDKYMGEDIKKGEDSDLRKTAFEKMREKHKSILNEHKGGISAEDYEKGEKLDRRTLRDAEKFEDKRLKEQYIYVRIYFNQKTNIEKVVYARKEELKYTNKQGTEVKRIVYRDRLGHFTRELED